MTVNYSDLALSVLLFITFSGVTFVSLSLMYGYERFLTYPRRMLAVALGFFVICGVGEHVSYFVDDLQATVKPLILSLGLVCLTIAFFAFREHYSRELFFMAGLVWSDPEKESEARRIDETKCNLSERMSWLVSVYTSSSKCRFNSAESLSSVKQCLLAGEHETALTKLAGHLDMLLLDKVTDINKEQLDVLNSFGSVVDNSEMLKMRIAESQMMDQFLSEKALVLSTLCFSGSFYSQQEVEAMVKVDTAHVRVTEIAGQIADLYLYKRQRGYEPVYRNNM